MDAHKRTEYLFDEAKRKGLENPVTQDGMPTRGMVASAICDAENDSRESAKSFLRGLDRAIDFHQNNANDPHGIGNAVLAALNEVRTAYEGAFGTGR